MGPQSSAHCKFATRNQTRIFRHSNSAAPHAEVARTIRNRRLSTTFWQCSNRAPTAVRADGPPSRWPRRRVLQVIDVTPRMATTAWPTPIPLARAGFVGDVCRTRLTPTDPSLATAHSDGLRNCFQFNGVHVRMAPVTASSRFHPSHCRPSSAGLQRSSVHRRGRQRTFSAHLCGFADAVLSGSLATHLSQETGWVSDAARAVDAWVPDPPAAARRATARASASERPRAGSPARRARPPRCASWFRWPRR